MYTSQEIFNEFQETTHSTETSNYNHLFYYTEDDDHEIESYIGEPRFGIETIKRKRWGQEQKLHGKVSKFRDRYKRKYKWQPSVDLGEDLDPFREKLHESTLDLLDIEGIPVEAQKVFNPQDDYASISGANWRLSTNNASTHFTKQYLALESIAYELKNKTTEEKFIWIKENEQELKKFFKLEWF